MLLDELIVTEVKNEQKKKEKKKKQMAETLLQKQVNAGTSLA